MMMTDSGSLPTPATVDWLTARAARARTAGHRALVVLAGPRDWGRAHAETALGAIGGAPVLWVSDTPPAAAWAITGRQARSLLGRETAHVAFDAFAGFHPDAFAAVAGTLRASGMLLLITPPLAEWPTYPDPEYARITVEPWGAADLAGRFLRRLGRRLEASPDVTVIAHDRPLPALPPAPAPSAFAAPTTRDPTPDQAAAIHAIERVATGRARRPVALVADRGRGKSAALGLAAAAGLGQGLEHIIVTAPIRAAVAPVFDHAAERLPGAHRRGSHIACGNAAITFWAPDELLREQPTADLLLVDEAAALPGPLLEALLRAYPRIAFATTLHGYEGSGRGFEIRFERVLDRITPAWCKRELTTPIRWAAGDPLEAFVYDALLLDADPAPLDAAATPPLEAVAIEPVDRDDLVDDEPTLRRLFAVLMMAHYRTTPGDLRTLLDGPNCRIWLARHGERVVAACLVAAEGPLTPALGAGVARGERRLHGHLLPQTLAFHAHEPEAVGLTGWRVVRIAVQPGLEGRGLGRRLLHAVRVEAERSGVDYWGAAFGATAALIRFWAEAGMHPVRLGVKRDAASGQHAAVMIGGLSPRGCALSDRVRQRFAAEWPLRVPEFFADLDTDRVRALSGAAGPTAPLGSLDDGERAALTAFREGHQPYENVAVAVWKFTVDALSHGPDLADADARAAAALITRVVQKRGWAEAAQAGGYTGQREVRAALRRALNDLAPALEEHGDARW